jgi:glycosyltransferase involved in cell wall biosynthesis
MIVKNEAAVLPRALSSVRGLCDRFSIVVDTDTSDDTVEVIRYETAPYMRGAIHMRPWPPGGFGEARTEALALARLEGTDWILMLDADDVIERTGDTSSLDLSVSAYELDVEDAGVTYTRIALTNAARDWRYVGVRHEAPEGPGPVARLAALRYRRIGGPGAERGTDKYKRDALALADYLAEHPDDARTAFYLAQSYRDAGQLGQALAVYDRRAAMQGWDEESFVARVEAAKLRAQLGCSRAEVIACYLAAWEYRPTRAEPLVYLARYLDADHPALAEIFRTRALRIRKPDDRLFVDLSCYASDGPDPWLGTR